MKTYDEARPTRRREKTGRARGSNSAQTALLSAKVKILGGAGIALVLLLAVMLLVGPGESHTTHIVWAAEKTTSVPGVVPESLRDRVREVGSLGGGTLTAYAVGDRAYRVDSVPIGLERDGQKVDDDKLRNAAVDRQLDRIADGIARKPVPGTGFSLYDALRVGADEADRTGSRVEVWLSTTVFTGSTDPLSISVLSQAEPSQAVEELTKGSLGDLDLSDIDLQLVMMSPTGPGQLPLTPRSESWRNKFMTALARRLQATVVEPVRDNAIDPAWPGSSTVPVVVPLPEPVVRPPAPQVPGDPPPLPRIDNAVFVEDSAQLMNPAGANEVVQTTVREYRAHPGRYLVHVTGYCARFGERDGAIRLSTERAQAIAALLTNAGVNPNDLVVKGLGYDELADPAEPPQSSTQRVVIINLSPR